MTEPDADDCGCQARRRWLNEKSPGLGDSVATVAEPIKEVVVKMPEMLRPDMKAIVWLAIGAFVVPMIMKKF